MQGSRGSLPSSTFPKSEATCLAMLICSWCQGAHPCCFSRGHHCEKEGKVPFHRYLIYLGSLFECPDNIFLSSSSSSVYPRQTFCQSKSQKREGEGERSIKWENNESLFGSCVQPATISDTFWSVSERNACDVLSKKDSGPESSCKPWQCSTKHQREFAFQPERHFACTGGKCHPHHVTSAHLLSALSFCWSRRTVAHCDCWVDRNSAQQSAPSELCPLRCAHGKVQVSARV